MIVSVNPVGIDSAPPPADVAAYRVLVPRAAGAPFVQTAHSASEALTKLEANRILFGDSEVYAERRDGTRIRRAELKRERARERLAKAT